MIREWCRRKVEENLSETSSRPLAVAMGESMGEGSIYFPCLSHSFRSVSGKRSMA